MIHPINYELEFEPNLRNFIFRGREIIEIKISKPTNTIKLNAAELKIQNCYLRLKEKIISAKTKIDEKKEVLIITLSKQIKGQAKICIDFTGVLNNKLLGFYKSQYTDIKGKTKYLATTQFEAADARRAFPCWDEPQTKATFDISIIAEKKYTAISNMPIKFKKSIGNNYLYKFSRTPIMSTYLIYLGVGEFEFLSSKLGKILVRVVTTKGNKTKGKFSLDLAKKFLRYYEKYFDIKYPLPKLDLIAVPDFAAGAMENWGAITFRETILLYDSKTSSTKTKQYIAEVISHELAHQWFGNLVTMKWWNDLWLNESFATYMATKIVNEFYPHWELWDQFLETSMNAAMMLDALKTSHPIDVKVRKPSEVREIFDNISYDKGGCVLRMLKFFVGESNFQKGLHYYLTKHRYQNATGQNLWESIEKVSKKPIKNMMSTWIKQVGFPIVEVSEKNSHLLLKQNRFLLEPDKKNRNGLWMIPISTDSEKKLQPNLMTQKSKQLTQEHRKKVTLLNSSREGFFRVKYSKKLLMNLKLLIEKKMLNHIDRWSIQNDLFALCVAGDEKVSTYLDFTQAYYGDPNYLSSLNVANNLNFLFLLTYKKKFSSEIKEHTYNYYKHLFERLGWDPKNEEKHTDTLLRGMVLFVLGKLEDKEVLLEAKRRFKTFLKNPSSLHPDLREVVYSLVAMNGDNTIHNQLIHRYKKTFDQEEKLRFLVGLCHFRTEKLLLKTLKFSLGKDVRSQNISLPILRISSNPYGKRIMWPWMKKNWKQLSKKFGFGNPMANKIVASISLVADSSMQKEIRQFFRENPVPGTERTLAQTLERIRIHTALLNKIRNEFKN